MKLTKEELKQIIKEEMAKLNQESKFTIAPVVQIESNDVLQFIEDSMNNGAAPETISSALAQKFEKADLEEASNLEDIEGWTIAEDIISAAMKYIIPKGSNQK